MTLSQKSPESMGIPSSAILSFVEAAESELDALHSVMILKQGHVVAQGWWAPYAAKYNHKLFSLSKSFTSTAIGLAVSENRLSIDDRVVSFFPEALPKEPSDNLQAMRIRDLLSMTSGHQNDTLGCFFEREDGKWTHAFLALPVEHKPGTHWVYNTGATYMLSAILQKVTGETLQAYLHPRLFEPLGIQNPKWEISPEGINLGGWGLYITTEDIARFGQLYLQNGEWNGQQLIPREWVKQATMRQASNGSDPERDWEQGYGYQFWRCRHNAYRGDGAFGQFCLVMPDQDTVIAITAGLKNMQDVLNLVWKHLLPAMQDDPLPENDQAHTLLQETLSRLSLQTTNGQSTSPTASQVSQKTYTFETNPIGAESVTFDFGHNAPTISMTDTNGNHQISCGYNTWVKGETAFAEEEMQAIASSGAWVTDNTYVANVCFYETPVCATLTSQFDNDTVRLTYQANVGFGANQPLLLTGKIAG